MDRQDEIKRIAIACQGGGSHTAFAAGVLKTIAKGHKKNYEIVALSGTSGGAICALLAWYGLLTNSADKAVELLDSFWRDNSVNSFLESLYNDWSVGVNRFLPKANLYLYHILVAHSPYLYTSWAQGWMGHWANQWLKQLIEKHVEFENLKELVTPSSPLLLVNAINIHSGETKTFRSHKFNNKRKIFDDSQNDGISADAILASTAIAPLFEAVRIGEDVYWDALFAQNPPIRDLLDTSPDEIWVVQVSPVWRENEPKSMTEILDRRNELAGNLSLNQELHFIEKINELINSGFLSDSKFKLIQVRKIEMLRELDLATKIDRSPSFIQKMLNYGEEQAERFLKRLS